MDGYDWIESVLPDIRIDQKLEGDGDTRNTVLFPIDLEYEEIITTTRNGPKDNTNAVSGYLVYRKISL